MLINPRERYFKNQGFQEGFREGFQEGFQESIEEGILEGKLETARNLLKEGFYLGEVVDVTGLSEEVILNGK